MYFCDPEQPYKHFDICKSYPNVLLKNKQLLPSYGIHDLEKTGEFYIDEVVLDKYGCDLKIEAGFYSNNLVKYFVEVLKIDPDIKYKLITHKSFIELIFTNFDQKQSKLLANSFIDNLGTKYNKINHGFACRDYETAMNVWTSGVYEKMNITIDNYNDLYLIREQKIQRLFSETSRINRFVVSEAILYVLNLIVSY